ncbi:hypothetical protein HYU09_03405 [Candidatus Woesearchaeota archaeon]|nr:hypothetical protein [Candidatus Woesearchaeota archaeon]
MSTNEQILDLVKKKGPILPVHVSKQINDNLLMTSARLSELLSNKKIKISSIKVGGSPLYYVEGQEIRLQDFSDNLGSKEKEAYNLLKEKKILRDAALEPAIRVALRIIKDFSIPLNVNYDNRTEIFWKWYLTQNNEAQEKIREILSKKIEPDLSLKNPQAELETPKQTETQKPLIKEEIPKTLAKEPEKAIIKEKAEQKKEARKKPKHDNNFNNKISSFFNKNKIEILETKEIKTNIETDFIVELATSIGNAKYFCKTKNKAKINESDLSTALLSAQSKGLPLIFLTNGEISKKAKEMMNNEFKNIIYREI